MVKAVHQIAILLVALLALGGCASNRAFEQTRAMAQKASSISELTAVPFFPQTEYQCGPAALATVMGAAGLDIAPESLASQVFIAERQGSMQIELQAATRRQGLIPYVHSGGFASLLNQLNAGVPVLVLQNLAFAWAPTWHYAVVVGYDADLQEVLLRSGKTELKRHSLREFARTWRLGDDWFMTVHPPDELPLEAQAEVYLAEVAGLERVGQLEAALAAYQTATRAWPLNWVAWMGLGNTHYQLFSYEYAEHAYRQALPLAPEHPAPQHNLAWSLIKQQRLDEASYHAQAAAALSDTDQYRSALEALRP